MHQESLRSCTSYALRQGKRACGRWDDGQRIRAADRERRRGQRTEHQELACARARTIADQAEPDIVERRAGRRKHEARCRERKLVLLRGRPHSPLSGGWPNVASIRRVASSGADLRPAQGRPS